MGAVGGIGDPFTNRAVQDAMGATWLGGMDLESMMVMVEAKYGELSNEFNQRMEDENTRGQKLKSLQEAQSHFQLGEDKGLQPGSPEALQAAQGLEDSLGYATGADKEMLQQKIAYMRDSNNSPMSQNDINQVDSWFKTKEDELNGDAQMNLLHIQDVVSKIQSLMSTTSNIQSTAHDMQKSIIANIRS